MASRLIKCFRRFTSDDKLPSIDTCKDYFCRTTTLDLKFYSRCIDWSRHLWMMLVSGREIVEEVMAETSAPEVAIAEFVPNPLDPYWLKWVRERFPKTVLPKYFDAFEKYLDGTRGWESHRKVAKQIGVAKATVTEAFHKIEGAMKREMGYAFEVLFQREYRKCPLVLETEPSDDRPAPNGTPDLVAHTTDGRVRIVSIKIHNENESITISKKSPEVRLLGELLERGVDAYMVVEGLFQGHFYSVAYDAETRKSSVRVRKRDLLEWPPDLQQLLEASSRPPGDRLKSPSAPAPPSAPSGVGGSGVVE